MMRLLNTFSITIAVTVLVAATVFLLRIPSEIISLIGWSIAACVVIALTGGVILAGAVGYENFRIVQARRKQAEYQIHIDGFGQSHYIGNDGKIRNLTSNGNPDFHRLALLSRVATNGRTAAISPDSPLMLPAPTPDLMPILDKSQRVLIKAASNGGKTTLLQHIAARRTMSSSVVVLDSQSYPDKWPAGCRVIGAGSNHPAISKALDGLIELMVKRYQEISQGLVKEGEHPKLTIIIDEWMAIVDQCQNAGDVIRRLLTESRKAAFSVFIGSHSERVRSLGLDGRGDLRDGFLIVRIEVANGEYRATYDQGRGEQPCLLPGEYSPIRPGDYVEVEIPVPQTNGREQQIAELIQAGKSDRAICQEVFGYVSSNHYPMIQKVRANMQNGLHGAKSI